MLAASACGGGSSPTTPRTPETPTIPPPSAPAPTPGPHIVTGTTTNALDGSGAAGVSFTAFNILVGVSGGNGAFSVGFHGTGANRTTLAATGFVTRETGITAPGGPVSISLIPSTFDLTAFNEMFRHSSSGLTRWTSAPGLVLERRVIDFTEVCAQSYTALDEVIPSGESDSIITDMRDGFELLTAGRLGPLASVATQQADAGGTVIPRQPGKIVVMRGKGLQTKTTFWGYACWSTTGDGQVTGGFIVLDRDFDASTAPNLAQFHRSLRMHELGHTLGCQHVQLTTRVSVMNSNARTEPNDFDRQAARLAMLRPTGNRTPDTDPSSHIASTATRGTQTVTWHGAH